MNRLLMHARQMHQRRMNAFYLTPDSEDGVLARLSGRQLVLAVQRSHATTPPPLYRDEGEAFDDGYGFDDPDVG